MDGVEARRNRWRSLRERLGLKGMMIGCCGGSTWGVNPSTMVVQDDDVDVDNHQVQQLQNNVVLPSPETESSLDLACVPGQTPGQSGMNLAAALAAERHFRTTQDEPMVQSNGPIERSPDPFEPNTGPGTVPGTPSRVSLMELLEESEGGDGEMEAEERDKVGNDTVCCVCMGRKKDAAFIPCGHTFCRVCSRELWLNRGCCPLCNRSIHEILDIY
ncbi:hypothetical protein RJ641_018552 [Dillenia turbinata]|uniref:RING-type domain-containing protein n=1 Tax=Dillenia turbinata TaxID=194707 RepID=A0AAN8UUF1_9MAGN